MQNFCTGQEPEDLSVRYFKIHFCHLPSNHSVSKQSSYPLLIYTLLYTYTLLRIF